MKRLTLLLVVALIAACIPSLFSEKTAQAVVSTAPGCATITSPSTGTLTSGANIRGFKSQSLLFNAGETISVTFTPADASTNANARLYVEGVDTIIGNTLPVTLSYTFPANATINNLLWKSEIASGSVNYTVTCGVVAPSTSSSTSPIPGPDMIKIPEGSAMGTFLVDSPLYFAPAAISVSPYTMKAGQSLWVFGMSADGAFYQVVLAGSKLWVPVGVIGPTNGGWWHNNPLPTTVVN